MAGMPIAGDYVAVLEGVQGDQDFIRILFQPARRQIEFGTIFLLPRKNFVNVNIRNFMLDVMYTSLLPRILLPPILLLLLQGDGLGLRR